jgi:hypothetical protein
MFCRHTLVHVVHPTEPVKLCSCGIKKLHNQSIGTEVLQSDGALIVTGVGMESEQGIAHAYNTIVNEI